MGTSYGVKFWGTRGLISSPRKETAIYGGNTTCMQIVYKDHLIIVDTGFGACNLGEKLMQQISEGYVRALSENDVQRRLSIWQVLEPAERKLAEQMGSALGLRPSCGG